MEAAEHLEAFSRHCVHDLDGEQVQLDELFALLSAVKDGEVSPDGYAVNDVFTVNNPHPPGTPRDHLIPNQTMPTIGDRLSAKGIAWNWYSGGWNDAAAGKPGGTGTPTPVGANPAPQPRRVCGVC